MAPVGRILNVKDDAVTRGVLDKDLHTVGHVVEVTYEDVLGVPHTVYAHKDGPFKSPEDIANAHAEGRLHENAADDDSEQERGADDRGGTV